MTWQKWFIWGLGCVAALCTTGETKGQKTAPPSPGSSPVALVNGEPIAMAELDAVLQLIPPKGPPPNEAEIRQDRLDILEMLIDDLLIRQFLSKNTKPVSQAELAKEFELLQTSLKSRKITLKDFLKDTKQTEAHLRMDIVKKLQWEHYINEHESEGALKHYYEENRDYYDMVKVRLHHILIRLSPKASENERSQSRAQLQQLRQQILAGQITFADAARKHSQCESASKGGDIGYFIRKFVLDERIARAAFALKIGEVTEPVDSEYGVHLLTVTDRTKGEPSRLEAIKDTVRQHYAMEIWQNILAQERKTATIETKFP
jgi:peptidyl-prolyl cis-trans isomerase C